MENIIQLVFGAVSLFFGLRLFWLFVALVGFLFGLSLPAILPFLSGYADWMRLALSLAFGVLAAILSSRIAKLIGAVIGFIVGISLSSVVTTILSMLGMNPGDYATIVSVILGILLAVFVLILFDPAIIFVSSLWGSIQIMSSLHAYVSFNDQIYTLGIFILWILGLAIQFKALSQKSNHENT